MAPLIVLVKPFVKKEGRSTNPKATCCGIHCVKHWMQNGLCDCCEPWTVGELFMNLSSFIHDFLPLFRTPCTLLNVAL